MKLTMQSIQESPAPQRLSSLQRSATTRTGVAATPSARPCPALRSLSSRIHLRILRLLRLRLRKPLHLHLRSPPHRLSLPPQHSLRPLHSHRHSLLLPPSHQLPLSPPLLHLPRPTRPPTLRPLRRQPPIHLPVSRQPSRPVTLPSSVLISTIPMSSLLCCW